MIQEPEGFALRDRRSTKTSSAKDWLPADALYSASRDVGANTTALFVAWKNADGTGGFRAAGTVEQIDSLLLRAAMRRCGNE